MLTRTLYVNITGTLTNLAMAGPSGGTWKLVDGKAIGVFGLGTEVDSQVCHLSFLLVPRVRVLIFFYVVGGHQPAAHRHD